MRRLLLLVLLGALLSACTDRTSLREAKRTIAVADSLDACGQVYADTLALQRAEQAFRGNRKLRARVYYYLGRNYEKALQPGKAVECMLKGVGCRPRDKVLLGRIYVNMAQTCAQQNEYGLATVFFRQAVGCFRKAEQKRLYANTLVSISANYGRCGKFNEAETCWRQAVACSLEGDSTYKARLYETKAAYLRRQACYDSALYYLHAVENYPGIVEQKDYRYQLLMQTYYDIGQFDKAGYYAERVAQCSANNTFLTNAYYVLMENAKRNNDAYKVAEYAHKRTDCQDSNYKLGQAEARTIAPLQEYAEQLASRQKMGILPVAFLLFFVALGIGTGIFWLKHRRTSPPPVESTASVGSEVPAVVPASPSVPNVESLLINVHKQVESLGLEKALHWDDYTQMCQDVNMYLYGFVQRLEQLPPAAPLSETDVRICILTLLSMPMKQMADYLHRSPNSMKNLKQVTAHKLGVTSAQLRPFLLKLLC